LPGESCSGDESNAESNAEHQPRPNASLEKVAVRQSPPPRRIVLTDGRPSYATVRSMSATQGIYLGILSPVTGAFAFAVAHNIVQQHYVPMCPPDIMQEGGVCMKPRQSPI
jgi:hypothetical protein